MLDMLTLHWLYTIHGFRCTCQHVYKIIPPLSCHVCNVDLTLLIIIDQETPNNRIVSLLFFEADIISLLIFYWIFFRLMTLLGVCYMCYVDV